MFPFNQQTILDWLETEGTWKSARDVSRHFDLKIVQSLIILEVFFKDGKVTRSHSGVPGSAYQYRFINK